MSLLDLDFAESEALVALRSNERVCPNVRAKKTTLFGQQRTHNNGSIQWSGEASLLLFIQPNPTTEQSGT